MKIFTYINERLRGDIEEGLPIKELYDTSIEELYDEIELLKRAYHRLLQQRAVQRRYRQTEQGRDKNRIAVQNYRDRKKKEKKLT